MNLKKSSERSRRTGAAFLRRSWLRCLLRLLFLSWEFGLGNIQAQIPRPPLEANVAFAGATLHHYTAADGRTPLRLYVFAPPAAQSGGARAGIVFFHGSGWVEGWVEQFSAYARALAAQGIVAVCADYRTQKSHGATPFDAAGDARAAVRWLRAHAAELGLDGRRLAVAGASSGAHIALCAAVFPDAAGETISARPDALVLFSAVTDTTMDGYPAGVPLFGGRERDLSPRHHLSAGLPPMLLLHGNADVWVPVASTRRFATEATALGNRAELVVFAGRGHAFFNHADYRPGVRPDDFFTCLFLTEQFLAGLGWIKPPAGIGSAPLEKSTP